MIIAVAGAGGKTTLIHQMAEKYRAEGRSVFVTTSTHMLIEEDTVLTDDAKVICRVLKEKGYVMAGIPFNNDKAADTGKIGALSKETYEEVCAHADVTLIEADGSKHMPVKFPREAEPVIYENVDEIIVVCGMHALGKTIREAAFRKELVMECLGVVDSAVIRAEHIQKLVQKGYVEPLREMYPDKKVSVYAAGAKTLYERAVASMLRDEMDVSLLKEEWFAPKPSLFILGGGHVGQKLAMAAMQLDFRVTVMDEREEFASEERFPGAERVICDSFHNLGQYMEEGAYYAIMTRGHAGDLICLREVLKHSYAYVGMIGSRRKVAAQREILLGEGVSEEVFSSVHAPIGLPIKAATPAEIAISVLAEIILEKNSRNTSSISAELLNSTEHGTLCIIIDKTGSAPRGVGSMMLVTKEKVYDSVGGGAIENAVLKAASSCEYCRIDTYDLDNSTSAKLGMICGGTNKILMIPV